MAFCHQCGQQIPDEALFCVACGSPQGSAGGQQTTGPAGSFDFKAFGELAKDTVVGMLTSPISTIRTTGGMELQNSLIMGGLLAVYYGLLGMWVVGTGVSSFMGYFGGGFNEYGSVFMCSLLIAITFTGGLFLGLFLIGKYLFKGNGTGKEFLNAAVVGQIPFAISLVAGIILAYISPYLLLLLINIGVMISFLCNYAGLQQVTGMDENRTAFALVLAYIVMFLVIFLVAAIIFS